MAKVYDALKRLEEERSRDAAILRAGTSLATIESGAPGNPARRWMRWPWSTARPAEAQPRADESPGLSPSADVARLSGTIEQLRDELSQVRQELVHAVDSRAVEVLAQERGTRQELSEIEQRVLSGLGSHVDQLGSDLDRRVLAAVDQLAGRIERLQARQSLLIGLIAAALLLSVLR
jgi:hypothetical protein